MIDTQYYGEFQDMATQHMLAPIFFSLVADKAVNKDGLFIFNNELYKALVDIAIGDEIVIGDGTGANDNATPASTIAEEIGDNSWTYSSAKDITIGSSETNVATLPTDVKEIEVWIERRTGTYMLFCATLKKPPFATSDQWAAMISNAGSNAGYFYTLRALFKETNGALTVIKSVGSEISETFKVVYLRYR